MVGNEGVFGKEIKRDNQTINGWDVLETLGCNSIEVEKRRYLEARL